MKVVFLDVDGVLNGHEWCHTREGPRIMREPARLLHLLLQRSGAKVVVISTWRCWVHDGLMTPRGFSKVLLSHGIEADVIDVLPTGEVKDRPAQIRTWLHLREKPPQAYVVIDDLPMSGLVHVRTHPGLGLRPHQVTEALKLLKVS